MIYKGEEFRTDPLTVYPGGEGWQRISSMRMRRETWSLWPFRPYRLVLWRTRWQPWHELVAWYMHDGTVIQPADVEAHRAETEGGPPR